MYICYLYLLYYSWFFLTFVLLNLYLAILPHLRFPVGSIWLDTIIPVLPLIGVTANIASVSSGLFSIVLYFMGYIISYTIGYILHMYSCILIIHGTYKYLDITPIHTIYITAFFWVELYLINL